MARQRMHKPELITHVPFIECSVSAQLLLILLENFCDDNGNHSAHMKSIKAQVFPAHDFTLSDVKGFIDELINNELLIEYEVDNKRYYHINGWNIDGSPLHQTINRPQPSDTPIFDHSLIVHAQVTEQSRVSKDKLSKDKLSKDNICVQDDVRNVYEYWGDVWGHPRMKMNEKEHTCHIREALKIYTVKDCYDAIDGARLTPHNLGQNENGMVYDGLHIILGLKNNNLRRFKDKKNKGNVSIISKDEKIFNANKLAGEKAYAARMERKQQKEIGYERQRLS
jgi:hypothetical protein